MSRTSHKMDIEESILRRAQSIKGIFLDVDGVLTDGTLIIDNNGTESKNFNVKDGLGIRKLLQNGINVAIISGRISGAVNFRARELGIREVHQGIRNKLLIYEQIAKRWEMSDKEAAFVTDDISDLPLFKRVGLAVAVADASCDVLHYAHIVTQCKGGRGAVRETAELILKAQNSWNP